MNTEPTMRTRHLLAAAFVVTLSGAGLLLTSAEAARSDFTITGSLSEPRHSHTATLLPSGRVLIAGGTGTNSTLSTAALFESGAWTTTAPMLAPRSRHTATLMCNAKVLVVGGAGSGTLASAEIYDPVAGTWTATASLAQGRVDHTATLLPNGKVLVVGGGVIRDALATAELYDPISGKWTSTGPLASGRYSHTATLLPDGKVLVAGGVGRLLPLQSAELYDPKTGSWSTAGTLAKARNSHTATLLPDGSVLVVGGAGGGLGGTLKTAELFDPSTKTWSSTGGLFTGREGHTATLLPDGKIIAIAGYNAGDLTFPSGGGTFLSNAEVYDPLMRLWTVIAGSAIGCAYHTATLLPQGSLLITGGQTSRVFASASDRVQFYMTGSESAAVVWTATGPLNALRENHTATLLPSGDLLVAGGFSPSTNAEIYHPATGAWSQTGGHSPRQYHQATLLPNGRVLMTGGWNASPGLRDCLLYDSSIGRWTATGPLNAGRYYHSATLLPTGKVLVAGGVGNTTAIPDAELYDSGTETWTFTRSMNLARQSHTATLLPGGKVLVTGGWSSGGSFLRASELYDPVLGTWEMTASMIAARSQHSATLLQNGKVLISGGRSDIGLSSCEIYDPVTKTWTSTGNLSGTRYLHTATLLNSGKVLVLGGGSTTAQLYDPCTGLWTGFSSGVRYHQTATLLADGAVLVAGGRDSSFLQIPSLYNPARFDAAWSPRITSISPTCAPGACLTVAGERFRGISEGSCGNSHDSPAGFPLLQLRSLDSGMTTLVAPASWSGTSFVSTPVTGFPPGFAMATIFANAIPGTGNIVNISLPVPGPVEIRSARRLANGAFQFAFTNTPGALFSVRKSADLSLPISSWLPMAAVDEVSPGEFVFTDPQPTNTNGFYTVVPP